MFIIIFWSNIKTCTCNARAILSIHVPLTWETRGLIGREEITKMKKGAILLNLARGEVVGTEALAEALKRGDLSGAARAAYQIHSKFIEIACIDNLDGRRVRFKTLFSKELINKLQGSCYTCLHHKE